MNYTEEQLQTATRQDLARMADAILEDGKYRKNGKPLEEKGTSSVKMVFTPCGGQPRRF